VYVLTCVASASFVFGVFVIVGWHGSVELRVALAGLYWLISTVAICGSSLLLWLLRDGISRGGVL